MILFFSVNLYSKVIIVSDIDETIKQTNVMDFKDALRRLIEGKDIPYYGLSYIYKELQSLSEVEIHYVSASYEIIYHAGEWLNRYSVPYTTYLQRPILSKKYEYKFNEIERIILSSYSEGDSVILFGDNNELDHIVYSNLMKKYYGKIYIKSFVRDIKGIYTTNLTRNIPKDGVFYFLTELDLFKHLFFSNLLKSKQLISNFNSYFLLPEYSRNYIGNYLSRKLCYKSFLKTICQKRVKKDFKNFLKQYFKNND